MGYKINVWVGDELVDDIELDIEPDKVLRIGVDKDQGEIASIGSPADNTAVNVRIYVATTGAVTGEQAQATAAVVNEEAVKAAAENQAPPENPQDPVVPDAPPVVDNSSADNLLPDLPPADNSPTDNLLPDLPPAGQSPTP